MILRHPEWLVVSREIQTIYNDGRGRIPTTMLFLMAIETATKLETLLTGDYHISTKCLMGNLEKN
jgi:hypothetical protein